MDDENEWNNLDDCSLFWPEEPFNLFGDHNLDLDFSNLFPPPVFQANNAFDPDARETAGVLDPYQSNLGYSSCSTLMQHESSESCPETTNLPPENAATGSSSLTGCLEPTNQASTAGFAPTGAESNDDEHELNVQSTKRRFFNAFSISSGNEVRLRSRKRFSAKRREVVARNRIIGVCLHCRLRKVAVGSSTSGQALLETNSRLMFSVTTAFHAINASNTLVVYPLAKKYVCGGAWLQRDSII